MTTDLHDLGALELAAAVRRREVSATEVTEHFLARAEGDDVGAFTVLAPDLALAQARETDRLLRDDPDTAGPLAGVPCPVKDLTLVAGVPARFGTAAIEPVVPELDDGVVQLLRRAGTVMLAKTSTPELGLPCYTEPDTGPPAVSPWDRTRSAGGSSGGAAAAVAAGLAPVAHGNDGGGSIRLPAACCGLVGLKPTRGLVSSGPYGQPGPGLASSGVLTRDVADTAALLDAIAHPWPGDWPVHRPDSFATAAARPPRRLRVGVLTAPLIHAATTVHPAALRAVERTAAALAEAGHELTELQPPFPPEAWQGFAAVWAVGALGAPVPPGREERLRPLTRWLRERGRQVSGVDHSRALQAMQRLTQQVDAAWQHVDVVLTPTMAGPPWPVGALRDDADPAADFDGQTAQTPWCSVWNITGAPSLQLPLHAEEVDGVRLPFGVLLGGRPGADAELLALGAELEGRLGRPVPLRVG